MTQFTDRFASHQVHSEIKALDESIASADMELSEGEIQDGYSRFLRAFGHVKRRLSQVDPELVPARTLSDLENQLRGLKDHHESFKQNEDINGLNRQADEVLIVLSHLPQLMDGAAEYSELVEGLRQRSNETLNQVRDRQKDLDDTSDQIRQHVDDLYREIAGQESRFESQKGRIDDLITNQQAKFNEELQQRNSQFNDAQKERGVSFDKLIAERQEELDALVAEKTDAADVQRQEFDKLTKEKMRDLQGHLDHAKKIVGLIGNTGMTGHYQKVANGELWRAEVLRVAAILFFVLMVLGVGWVVKEIKSDDFNWQVALFRVAVSLALLAPAIYCARESTRHRRSENRNRRIELELASIKPYLDSLPPEKAQAMMEQLAVRYFGNEVVDDDAKAAANAKMRPGEFMNFAERIVKLVRP